MFNTSSKSKDNYPRLIGQWGIGEIALQSFESVASGWEKYDEYSSLGKVSEPYQNYSIEYLSSWYW